EATSVRKGSPVRTALRRASSTRTRSSASQGSPSTTVMVGHGRPGSEREQTAAPKRQLLTGGADGSGTFAELPGAGRPRERYARTTAVKSEVNQRLARSRPLEKPEGRRQPSPELLGRGGSGRRQARVRALHRSSQEGRGPRPGGGPPAQPQLHRHGAHPPRADPRGGGCRRQGARIPRDLPRGRARPGGGDHRPGRLQPLGPHPVHAPRQEGPRALAAGGAPARPQL